MVGKKTSCALVLLAFALSCAPASVIAVQVVQDDDAHDEVRSSSLVVEGSLLDYFFESGHIVTNTPPAISSGKDDSALLKKSMAQAKSGGCDLFIAVQVCYQRGNTSSPEANLLSVIKQISWTVYRISTGEEIASGKKSPGTVSPARDSERGIIAFAGEVAATINQSLKAGGKRT